MSAARPGEFSEAARAAIYQVGDGRCIGCGRTDLNTHHRRRRGMGGTSDRGIGHPSNGVPLCGSGTLGCHAWTHSHPADGMLLGWNLPDDADQLASPFYDVRFGWRRWILDGDFPLVEFVDAPHHAPTDRLAAMRRFHLSRPILG